MGIPPIKVRIECGGEERNVEVPNGVTVQYLVDQGFIGSLSKGTVRLNGTSMSGTGALKDGDTLVYVPTSGKQG